MLLLALLSSYYMAVLALTTAGVWGLFELTGSRIRRGRFIGLSTAATVTALCVVVLVSQGYFRAAATGGPTRAIEMLSRALSPSLLYEFLPRVDWGGLLPAALAMSGLVALAWGSAVPKRMAMRGVVLLLLGLILVLGPMVRIGGWDIPLPYALLAATPAKFFRGPHRFFVVAGFGAALLTAAALELVVCRSGRTWRFIAIAGALIALAGRSVSLGGTGPDHVHAASAWSVYDAVRCTASRDGPGPLLELPLMARWGGTEADAMVGSTHHWLPLVNGFTGFWAPHRTFINRTIRRLPADDALQDLVDATHLRWLLLHPEGDWPDRALRRNVLALGGLHPVLSLAGWQLVRVDREPGRPEWFRAIADGWRPGRTPLGTPLAPIVVHGLVTAVEPIDKPRDARPGRPLSLRLRIRNDGLVTWPAVQPDWAGPEYIVHLVAAWWPSRRESGPPVASEELPLPRDIAAGEEIIHGITVVAPPEPGDYNLTVTARQTGTTGLDGPGNRELRIRVRVAFPPPPSAAR